MFCAQVQYFRWFAARSMCQHPSVDCRALASQLFLGWAGLCPGPAGQCCSARAAASHHRHSRHSRHSRHNVPMHSSTILANFPSCQPPALWPPSEAVPFKDSISHEECFLYFLFPITLPTALGCACMQYDVLAYRYVKGKEGKMVYQFQMQRRPGQGHLQSDVSGHVRMDRQAGPDAAQAWPGAPAFGLGQKWARGVGQAGAAIQAGLWA